MTQILCTIGPASLNVRTLKRLDLLGVDMFRLNLSHLTIDALEDYIQTIKKHTTVPICLDTEGGKQSLMPYLTDKDERALEIGKMWGIKNVALSFAKREEDVERVRDQMELDSKVMAKIESRDGFNNVPAIAKAADSLLIDRDDLSREIPLERIPLAQKEIIRLGTEQDTPVYVATNLMESMMTQPSPTRAEVNDVYNTLLDGAAGLVLAGETAIGEYPISCVEMIKRIIDVYEEENR